MVNTEIRLIIFFAGKDGEALYSQQKKWLGDNYGTDHELFIAKFRIKLKKVEKTTRPFRYDLNQILDIMLVQSLSSFSFQQKALSLELLESWSSVWSTRGP